MSEIELLKKENEALKKENEWFKAKIKVAEKAVALLDGLATRLNNENKDLALKYHDLKAEMILKK